MILRIEPDIQTFLDALTGAFRGDQHVEQRIVEVWLACIERKGGTTDPPRGLFRAVRDSPHASALFERSAAMTTPGMAGDREGHGVAPTLHAVAQMLGASGEGTIAAHSTHLATVLLARVVLARHIAQMCASIKALQLTKAYSAVDRPSEKTLTPAIVRDVVAISFTETADRAMYHLAQIDATLFELLTRLPATIEGPRSPRPFPEDELCAYGFPNAKERKAWNAGAALPVRSLEEPQQPITSTTVHGGRPRREN